MLSNLIGNIDDVLDLFMSQNTFPTHLHNKSKTSSQQYYIYMYMYNYNYTCMYSYTHKWMRNREITK